jgi:hypothetical protein
MLPPPGRLRFLVDDRLTQGACSDWTPRTGKSLPDDFRGLDNATLLTALIGMGALRLGKSWQVNN